VTHFASPGVPLEATEYTYGGYTGRIQHPGSRGQSPWWEKVRVRSHPLPQADKDFVFRTLIFNVSAIVLHEMTYSLSCFFCDHDDIHQSL